MWARSVCARTIPDASRISNAVSTADLRDGLMRCSFLEAGYETFRAS
jgi:hypothetical protein